MKRNKKSQKELAYHKKKLYQKRKNKRKLSSMLKIVAETNIEQDIVKGNKGLYEKDRGKTVLSIKPNKEEKICALCKVHKADKKNTHYLSDSIIRRNLNLDGGNSRETGFYYTLGDEPYIKFGFQRNTNIERVKQELQREPTSEECEEAKKNPFSVDDVFCKVCEDRFTAIETKFIKDILPKIRKLNSDDKEICIDDIKTTKLFFILQLWRTSICDTNFKLPKEIQETMRTVILNADKSSMEDINKFPISVSYLITEGNEKENTSNITGVISDEKYPKVILMNDFIIQFYNPATEFWFDEIYGVNEFMNYYRYINLNKDSFLIKVISNDKRLEILNNMEQAKMNDYVRYWINLFLHQWFTHFKKKPSLQVLKEFQEKLTTADIRSFYKTNKIIENIINEKLNSY